MGFAYAEVTGAVWMRFFLFDDEGFAGHFGGLGQAHDLQGGGGDVGEDAVVAQLAVFVFFID